MGKILQFTKDALVSLVNGMGIMGQDKAASTVYMSVIYTDQQLAEMYRASWLPKKIVNIPAFDSFRKWVNWQADAADITAIEEEAKRLNVKGKLLQVRKKARLFGGAALYIGTKDSDPSQPFDPKKVAKGGITYLNIMLKRDLKPGDLVKDPASEYYGRYEFYTLNNGLSASMPNMGQQVVIHASRLVLFYGDELPDPELTQVPEQGWGDSVLVSTLSAIKQADGTAANIASLVFEAKVDIIRVPDLMASLADPEYEGRLLSRFRLANIAKGTNGMLLLDKDEEYDSKSTNFTNLPEVLMAFMQIVSGAADIPATRLLGQAPAGMNATGESDLRNYYDRIQAEQTTEIDPAIHMLMEAVIWSALGGRDKDTHYVWAPLWQVSDKERADIGWIDAQTISKLNDTGLFPQEALAKAGTNMLVEHSIMPGLLEEIDGAGGLPDYELEAKQAAKEAKLAATANSNAAPTPAKRIAANDARPMSLYLSRKVINSAELRAWAKGQGFTTVQDDLHVTIVHTRTPIDWIKVGQSSSWGEDDSGNMTINGGPRLMERFGDAIVLQFAASRLGYRFESIVRDFEAIVDFPEYQPHITISWQLPEGLALTDIEPYRGKIVFGPEIFEEVKDDWKSNVVES